jgi:hypothetical protein
MPRSEEGNQDDGEKLSVVNSDVKLAATAFQTVRGFAGVVYKDVKNFHTSAGTQVHLHVSEQVLGGVAHVL